MTKWSAMTDGERRKLLDWIVLQKNVDFIEVYDKIAVQLGS